MKTPMLFALSAAMVRSKKGVKARALLQANIV
jgi:hypothetical protein